MNRTIHKRSRGLRRLVAAVLLCALAALVAVSLAGVSGGPVRLLTDRVLYDGIILGAFALCVWRAVAVPRDRTAWALLGASMFVWAMGDLLWPVLVGDGEAVLTFADALYMAFYPLAYAGLVLLVRARSRGFRPSVWADGLCGLLGAAALGAAALAPLLSDVGGSGAEVAVNLAYPLGDLVLLSLVVGMLAVLGRQLGRVWLLLGGGLAIMAVADTVYLYLASSDAYAEGGLLDTLWPAAALIIAAAAWSPPGDRVTVRPGRLALLAPTVCAAIGGIVILAVDHVRRLDDVSVTLAAAVLVAVVLRAILVFRENDRVLEGLSIQALTDPLTGLGNRRSLVASLEEVLDDPDPGRPHLLVILDLDGFKGYNDAFGHPAGDGLLHRLGHKLAQATAPAGRAYRLGGDEFCALFSLEEIDAETAVDVAAQALGEDGEGFSIRASLGAVFLPDEAATAADAFRVADRRLYSGKRGRRLSPDWQTQNVLSQAIREREPDLLEHHQEVVELAVEVGRRLGLAEGELQDIARAAALHDVGKLAIPDDILRKPGPLTEAETALMRRHSIIGERILAAAPALAEVSRIVRHSHERIDGSGYPDGLVGDAIPLGARIVAACDAFEAMTTDRCYRGAMDAEDALAEIRRCAGTQFDPAVAGLLERVVRERMETSAWRPAARG
jgi:diguanylate cyclase (GGDEF)-like protein